jgi:hypothetical protein
VILISDFQMRFPVIGNENERGGLTLAMVADLLSLHIYSGITTAFTAHIT